MVGTADPHATFFLEPGESAAFLAWLDERVDDNEITQSQSDIAWFFADLCTAHPLGGWLYDHQVYMFWEGDDRLLEVIILPDNLVTYFVRVGEEFEVPENEMGEPASPKLYQHLTHVVTELFTRPITKDVLA